MLLCPEYYLILAKKRPDVKKQPGVKSEMSENQVEMPLQESITLKILMQLEELSA